MGKGEGGDEPFIGQRIHTIRRRRGLSRRACAERAGMSVSRLSGIEAGERPVDRVCTLEALAGVLQVGASRLSGLTRAEVFGLGLFPAVAGIRIVLSAVALGDAVDSDGGPWEDVEARLRRVNEARSRADYIGVGEALPELLTDLHAHVPGPRRRAALRGLADCYLAAQGICGIVGEVDLALLASWHVKAVTEVLAGPEWAGLAVWSRAQAIGSTTRERQRSVAVRGAEDLSADLTRPEVARVYGCLHLVAAFATTTLGRPDTSADHVREAAETARRPGVGTGTGFARLSFGVGEVDIWRTLLAVEAGEGGRVVEIARALDPTTLPESRSRRAAWWIEVGRGLAMERRTRDEAVRAFRTAEEMAPLRFRTNPFAREIVSDLCRRARRDAGGRELRGLVHRMGIAL